MWSEPHERLASENLSKRFRVGDIPGTVDTALSQSFGFDGRLSYSLPQRAYCEMLEFRTVGFKGFSTKYSPFFDSRIAVATGQNFGLVGNGRLSILGLTPKGIVQEKFFDTQDCLYDLAWSELHENQILTANGDGAVKLFDIGVDQFPVRVWQEHAREVFCVHWNLVAKNTFLSSSWDGCIKIYDPNRDIAITTMPTHSCTYSAQFSPHDHGVVTAVSSDSVMRVYDLRTPASANNHLMLSLQLNQAPKQYPGLAPAQNLPPSEALTHDWNKYRSTVIASAGVDRVIRTWDIRNPNGGPLAQLAGHEYAVRKVTWSPHLPDLLLSASYDMSCRIWTDGSTIGNNPAQSQVISNPQSFGGGEEVGRMDVHTEFVAGVDWCLFGAEGWCASTAWDERVLVWDVRTFMRQGS